MSAAGDTPSTHDAIVVGARVAGAATAMLLARRGLRVLLVDRGRHRTDTLSTLALMRCGVVQLHRWGLLDAVRAAGTPPVSRTLFHYGDETLDVGIPPAAGVDALYAPRRTVLDPILVEAAREAGVEVRYGISVDDLQRDPSGRVTGIVARDEGRRPFSATAGFVVGADGTSSRVARAVAAPVTRSCPATGATIYGFFRGIGSDAYEWAFTPPVAAGVIPTNGGASCVFVAARKERFEDDLRVDLAAGFRRILEEVGGKLAGRVAAAEPAERLRGFPGVDGYFRRPWGPGWALVGDAGYFKDPISAHGISDALRDAELLSRAIVRALEHPELESAALAEYEDVRDRASTDLFSITNRIAAYDWSREEIQNLHRQLSRSMHAENELLAELGDGPEAA